MRGRAMKSVQRRVLPRRSCNLLKLGYSVVQTDHYKRNFRVFGKRTARRTRAPRVGWIASPQHGLGLSLTPPNTLSTIRDYCDYRNAGSNER
jgi:hypothetical protein